MDECGGQSTFGPRGIHACGGSGGNRRSRKLPAKAGRGGHVDTHGSPEMGANPPTGVKVSSLTTLLFIQLFS